MAPLGALWAGIPRWLRLGGAVAIIVAGALLLAYCAGKDAGGDEADKKRAEANTKILTKDAGIKERRDVERRDDVVRDRTEQKELDDARDNAENDADRRRRRACAIMRQQGTSEADLPVKCRPDR